MRQSFLGLSALALVGAMFLSGVTAIDAPASPQDGELRKLLRERYDAASKEMLARRELYRAGRVALDDVCAAIGRYAMAGSEIADSPAERIKLLASAVESAKFIEGEVKTKYENEVEPIQAMALATYTRSDMEIKLYLARKAVK